ncbi:MAG: signal peptidase I, partial [Proteobacteria bacterium]|nr:signal peptidase I [Pseudomonadota bacterium]
MKATQVLKTFLIATVLALGVRLFFVEDFRVSSDSMIPNLFQGDLIFVSKSAFSLRLPFSSFELVRFKTPKRSEVVAFSVPDQGFGTYIKRVVAIGGDRVEIKDGALWVNGEKASYVYLDENSYENGLKESWSTGMNYSVLAPEEKMKDYGPIDVPADHFFALGDNRKESLDSRFWGPVPYSCLKGKVSMVWLSVGPEGALRSRRWLTSI